MVRASPSPSPSLTLVAYSPLLSGAYVRADRPLVRVSYRYAAPSTRIQPRDEVVTADALFVDWLSAGVGGATHCDPYVAEA